MFCKLYLHTVTEQNTSHRDLSWIQSVIVTAKGGLRLYHPHQRCQSHRDEEFLILRGQRWNEPGIGCDVTYEIWSPQSIKWIPVPCASSSCRCVNVFCTVHPFVFSTLSSSSSHPPTRVARETFQRNCDELCIEMFKASFDSLVSAVVRFVMLWVEGVHWVMTWTIAGELSEVYDCGWLHLRICLFAAYLQRLVNKIWPLE